jgi:hypothetical protein
MVQVVQKQELRATFEKYGIVDEVYIAQAGEHTAHASQHRDAVLWIRIHMDSYSFGCPRSGSVLGMQIRIQEHGN